MDEKDWLLLKTLYEEKSITRAASMLFISQPALSTRLQKIEIRFNAQVVIRSKNGVRFTPEGEYLVKRAYNILKDMTAFEEDINNMRSTPTGTLRIGASNFFTKYLLPELLRRFKESYPAIEFQVSTGWSRDLVRSIYNGDVHIGFIRGNHSWIGEKHLLFEEEMCVVYKKKFTIENLPQIPLIQYQNDPSNQFLLDTWWSENFSIPPHIGMEVDRVDTCREMVCKGLGYGFLPSTILQEDQELYREKIIYKNGDPLIRSTWMFYQADALQLKLVEIFVDFIKKTKFNEII